MGLIPIGLRDSPHGSVYQSREILESPQGSGASCAGVGPGFCGLSGVHWSEARWGRAYWGHGQRWDSVYRSVEWRSFGAWRRDCRGGTWCLLELRWGITYNGGAECGYDGSVDEVRGGRGLVRRGGVCARRDAMVSSGWGWYIRRVVRDLVPRTDVVMGSTTTRLCCGSAGAVRKRERERTTPRVPMIDR